MEAWIPGTNFWFSEEENQKYRCAYLEPAGLAIIRMDERSTREKEIDFANGICKDSILDF